MDNLRWLTFNVKVWNHDFKQKKPVLHNYVVATIVWNNAYLLQCCSRRNEQTNGEICYEDLKVLIVDHTVDVHCSNHRLHGATTNNRTVTSNRLLSVRPTRNRPRKPVTLFICQLPGLLATLSENFLADLYRNFGIVWHFHWESSHPLCHSANDRCIAEHAR